MHQHVQSLAKSIYVIRVNYIGGGVAEGCEVALE